MHCLFGFTFVLSAYLELYNLFVISGVTRVFRRQRPCHSLLYIPILTSSQTHNRINLSLIHLTSTSAIMATFAYKAHLAARSSKERQIEKRSAPLPKHAEEYLSATFYPPVFARVQAHQLIHSRGDAAQRTYANQGIAYGWGSSY
ncbi:hypothetical protein AZE42_11988 [Rhizopogon vesiculosus]|uniref:Uncharacterized protein n=1 Tax=Rhizopogon vesiculosus TaxID=180088 RepID=A0A1J8R2I4_9AGAM|nr:hypothetical protein AZE42_11988 [Rhizopogon vesiculosus]